MCSGAEMPGAFAVTLRAGGEGECMRCWEATRGFPQGGWEGGRHFSPLAHTAEVGRPADVTLCLADKYLHF